jgi:uncharacterized membrane protein YhaH (DUF805 family)
MAETKKETAPPQRKRLSWFKNLFTGRINGANWLIGWLVLKLLAFITYIAVDSCINYLTEQTSRSGMLLINLYTSIASAVIIIAITLFLDAAIDARRMHDIGKSAWWILLMVIPIINYAVLVYLLAKRGEHGTNQYGQEPLSKAGNPFASIFNLQ